MVSELEGELDSHITNDVVPNRRNGKSKKTIKSTSGRVELEFGITQLLHAMIFRSAIHFALLGPVFGALIFWLANSICG